MKRTHYTDILIGLFVFFFCLPTMLLVPSARAGGFSADITQEVFNNHLVGRIYVLNDRYRMELHPRDAERKGRLIIIVDRKKGKTIILPPEATTYEEVENFTPQAYMADLFQSISNLEKIALKKKIGTETVAGYACEHYGFYDRDFLLADVWFATDLDSFPVKAHLKSGREDGNVKIKTNVGDSRMELSHIKIESVDASLFSVPQGVTKAEPRPGVKQEQAVLTETEKGAAPWGRRIGKGGQIHVKTDPRRPTKITLKSLLKDSVCTYTAIPQGKSSDQAKSIQVTLKKKGQLRKIEIDKQKKTEWVFIRVDEGIIFAKVKNEKDPFSFDSAGKIQEGYLTAKELQGLTVDPGRDLSIMVTGDNQDGPDSEVTLTCYRKQYKDQLLEKKVRVLNKETEQWKFSSDDRIQTMELSIGENGGVKYRVEQPALAEEQTGAAAVPGRSSTTKALPPKIVYTKPVTPHGSPKKVAPKNVSPSLGKAEISEILKALGSGDVATMKARLDKGMDPNALLYGAPLLQKAANLSSAEMVKLIIERGGDLHYKDRSGNDALTQAQSNNKHFQEVIPVLVEAGMVVDQNTPIWKIAFKTQGGKFKPGVKETLEYLLSKGADVNTPISKTGNTLLMFAAKMAWLEPVEFYLAKGADVNAKDKDGNTALSWARTERRGEQLYEKQHRKAIIELLQSKGAQ